MNNIKEYIKTNYSNITLTEYKKIYNKMYYDLNKNNTHFLEQRNNAVKNHYDRNKDTILLEKQLKYNDNPLKYRECRMKHHFKNKENEDYLNNRREQSKTYYIKNREKLIEYNKQRYYKGLEL
jgi:hypothetical protein